MINLSRKSKNVNVVTQNNVAILFSYDTPVAFSTNGGFGPWVVDPKKYSRTTSKHVNLFVPKLLDERLVPEYHASFRYALDRALEGEEIDAEKLRGYDRAIH